MRKVHISPKEPQKKISLECDQCEKKFEHPSRLRLHKIDAHGKYEKMPRKEKGPFICEHCGTTLKSACLLKYHLLTCNKGEKPFPCQECDKSYIHNYLLQRHIIIAHTPEAPKQQFACPDCSKCYTVKVLYEKHRRMAHGEVTEMFHCPQCSKSFMREYILKRHIRKTHWVKCDETVASSNTPVPQEAAPQSAEI